MKVLQCHLVVSLGPDPHQLLSSTTLVDALCVSGRRQLLLRVGKLTDVEGLDGRTQSM